jgi:hypothetical protein
MIDARGRPLRLSASVQERAQQMPRWVHAATADPLQQIPEEWLVPTKQAWTSSTSLAEFELEDDRDVDYDYDTDSSGYEMS